MIYGKTIRNFLKRYKKLQIHKLNIYKMNYDTYLVVKNARLAIERAEEMKKFIRLDLEKKKEIDKKIGAENLKESRQLNPLIWNAIDDINYKLNDILNKLEMLKGF